MDAPNRDFRAGAREAIDRLQVGRQIGSVSEALSAAAASYGILSDSGDDVCVERWLEFERGWWRGVQLIAPAGVRVDAAGKITSLVQLIEDDWSDDFDNMTGHAAGGC